MFLYLGSSKALTKLRLITMWRKAVVVFWEFIKFVWVFIIILSLLPNFQLKTNYPTGPHWSDFSLGYWKCYSPIVLLRNETQFRCTLSQWLQPYCNDTTLSCRSSLYLSVSLPNLYLSNPLPASYKSKWPLSVISSH